MGARDDGPEDPRRRTLVRALAAGLLAAGVGDRGLTPAAAQGIGRVPRPLPPGRSFYDIRGRVTVDGVAADLATPVGPDSEVVTAARSGAMFVVGKDAFTLRGSSRLKLSSEGSLVRGLRLFTGRLLSVFGRTRHRISTPVATIGIRGTGIYVESEPDRSYVCTCYGITEIAAAEDPSSTETIASEHHDAPRWVVADGAAGNAIRPAPFINHTDLELALVEALVGREPPFGFSFDDYRGTEPRY